MKVLSKILPAKKSWNTWNLKTKRTESAEKIMDEIPIPKYKIELAEMFSLDRNKIYNDALDSHLRQAFETNQALLKKIPNSVRKKIFKDWNLME